MNNSTQLIQKVLIEQASGFFEISVYKQYFLQEIDTASNTLVIPLPDDEVETPFKHHCN